MEMSRQAFICMELGEYERRFGERDFFALSEAVAFCHLNAIPTPEWVTNAVLDELHASFHGIGPRQRGLGRGHADRARWAAIQKQRAGWAEFYRSGGVDATGQRLTREQAFKLASQELIGTPAFGDPEQIRKAYDAQRKKARREKQGN